MDLSNHPRCKKFFDEHPDMSLDDALTFVENEILKQENKESRVDGKSRNSC
jgi:hypothetical protein